MTTDTRRLFEVLGTTALAALVLATLVPASWVPRTGLGWEDDHFLMYFATTTLLGIATRRPFVVAVSLIACAGLLEAMQGLTPDRFPDFRSALAGAAGVISATILVALVNTVIRKARSTMPSLTSTNLQ
jgi:VanZ family protein